MTVMLVISQLRRDNSFVTNGGKDVHFKTWRDQRLVDGGIREGM